MPGTFAYPAGVDDTDDWLARGSYEWKVEAYNGGTFLSSSTVYGSFVIDALPTVSGHRAAMYGTALASNTASCDATLPVAVSRHATDPGAALGPDPERRLLQALPSPATPR